MQEEMRSQKRLGKMTAEEVQAIKATMESFITNDLFSHRAQAIQLHFGAFHIAQILHNISKKTRFLQSLPCTNKRHGKQP